MKSMRLTIFALICAFPMAAQADVTLRLATPGDPVNNPIEDIEITASAIDAAVGTNFFSTQADALVADLAAMRADLEVELRNLALNNQQVIRVNSLTVATDPISVRLTQASGAVRHDIYWSGGFIASTTNGFLAIPIQPENSQIWRSPLVV
ncbi:MAG: hypothetical protein ACE5EM_03420 [Sphingomonadales bacterium]